MSCGIYKITNLLNNKCYIGQSINIEDRFKKHKNANDNFVIHVALRKYGIHNFSFEIIEECNISQLNHREKYWISFYNSLIPNGYNMIEGGSNGAGLAKGKQVEQYDLNGRLIAIYASAKQASEQTGIIHTSICKCCRGQGKYAGNYQWKYSDSNISIEPLINVKRNKVKNNPVYQYSLNGEYLNEYNSLSEAEKKTGIAKSTICNVCRGKGKTAGNFKWSYEKKKKL